MGIDRHKLSLKIAYFIRNKTHMNEDKEALKARIRLISKEIRELGDDEEAIAEALELDIAELIIEYSIRHNITIPLIDYAGYARRKELAELEEQESLKPRIKPFRRRKIDQPDDEPIEQPYDYFNDFLDAIGEEGLINPRFTLHPDIKELVECWDVTDP